MNVGSLEEMPLLTKFSKKHIEKIPLKSNRSQNFGQSQSVRDVNPSGYGQGTRAFYFPGSQRNYGQRNVNQRESNRQNFINQQTFGNTLGGTKFYSKKLILDRKHGSFMNQMKNSPRQGKPNLSKSVGLLPRPRLSQNQSNRPGRTPEKHHFNEFKTNQNYKHFRRSNTNQNFSNTNNKNNFPIRRKFSEIPEPQNWANQTLDLNDPRQNPNQFVSQGNNILSFKNDHSNENELNSRFGNNPKLYPNNSHVLRNVQSNMSHLMHSPGNSNTFHQKHHYDTTGNHQRNSPYQQPNRDFNKMGLGPNTFQNQMNRQNIHKNGNPNMNNSYSRKNIASSSMYPGLNTAQNNKLNGQEANSMPQMPMPYMRVPQKRASIELNNSEKNFSRYQNSPSQIDLLNTSQTIAPSVYMNPEPRSFSEEDMEHRLVLLFRKMLVFSSKIESLKEKIIVNNPDFSSYRLFMRFSGDRKTRMDLIGLCDFFAAFNFGFGEGFVEKVMIFLSKYRLEGPSSFAEGTGDEEGYEQGFDINANPHEFG